MADTDLIKRNIGKMIDQGAPESDINAYLATEGYSSPEAWRSAITQPTDKPKPVGAAMVQGSPRLEPGPRTSTMPDPGRPWGEVLSESARNFLPSVAKAGMGAVNALTLNLPQTAASLYDVGKGAIAKINRYQPGPGQTTMGPRPAANDEASVDALGQHFANTYGSSEGFKNALASDPASILMDAATVGTAGTALPGKVGQAANVLAKVDPLAATGTAMKYGGKVADVVGANALGRTTGAGARSIRDAGSAGRELGLGVGKDAETVANANALVTNMNKGAPVDNVVDRAKGALSQAIKERGTKYRQHMAEIGEIPETITFDLIDEAVGKATNIGTYKGVTTEPKAATTVKEMSDIINDWRGYDPAEFHTPEGIDALKRTLGNIRDSTKQGSPERAAAERIYHSVVGVIVDRAPKYADYMADYGRASDNIGEARRTFSLGEKATNDTAARKLLSATRDNVQTNNKGRANVLDKLSEYDSTLPYAVAGQALQSPLPRGLVANGAATYGAWNVLPGILADPLTAVGTMAAFSPRVVGNAVYYGGRAIGSVEDVAARLGITADRLRAMGQGGYQAGRNEDIQSRARGLRDANALAASAP